MIQDETVPSISSPERDCACAKLLGDLNAYAAEAHKISGGSFRDVCVGLEVAMAQQEDRKDWWIIKLVLGFENGAVKVEDVQIAEKQPPNYNVRGIWAVLYSMCMPRLTPFDKDPLRIRRISISYGDNPVVEYDRLQDIGLPLSLDRPYDAEKVQAAVSLSNKKM